MQAAILTVKLPYLDSWNNRRREIANRYNAAFAPLGLTCPVEIGDRYHVYHLYVLRVPQRDRFQHLLATAGINTMIHYPVPVHLQESYQEYQNQSYYLSTTENLAHEIVSLPIYPELMDLEVDYIIDRVSEVYGELN